MCFLFLEIVTLIFLLICFWLAWSYILLVISKRNADNKFMILLATLKECSVSLLKFIEKNRAYIKEQSIVEQTIQLVDTAAGFSVEKDSNERIIAYANSILKNLLLIRESMNLAENNIDESDLVQIKDKFYKTKNSYNKSAKRLRYYAEVFPTSLLARLKKITTMDYLN